MGIVDDFVAHIDRRAPLFERFLDDLDGPINASAEAARRRKSDHKRLPVVHFILLPACGRCAETSGPLTHLQQQMDRPFASGQEGHADA